METQIRLCRLERPQRADHHVGRVADKIGDAPDSGGRAIEDRPRRLGSCAVPAPRRSTFPRCRRWPCVRDIARLLSQNALQCSARARLGRTGSQRQISDRSRDQANARSFRSALQASKRPPISRRAASPVRRRRAPDRSKEGAERLPSGSAHAPSALFRRESRSRQHICGMFAVLGLIDQPVDARGEFRSRHEPLRIDSDEQMAVVRGRETAAAICPGRWSAPKPAPLSTPASTSITSAKP